MITKVFKARVKITFFTILTIFTIYLLSGTTLVFAEDISKKDLFKEKEHVVVSDVIKNSIGDNNNNKSTSVVADVKEIREVKKAENSGTTTQINTSDDIIATPTKVEAEAKIETTVSANEHHFTNDKDVKSTNNTRSANSTENTEDANNAKKIKKAEISPETISKNTQKQKNTTRAIRVADSVKEISFADNEQINVVLSNRDINRILVKGDKIQIVNGPTGLYLAKNDVTGAAYLSLYGETTFTVFISTLKGHNLSLLVTPRSIAGRTIILEPTTPSILTARFEETESYQKVLVSLISSMINNESLEDYSYNDARKVQKKQKNDFYGIADIRQITFYSGSHLLGIVSEITNKTKKPITLKPSYFYKPGVRAVALSQQTIAPLATGLLYQVISRE